MYKFRDKDKVFAETDSPAFLVDTDLFVMLKFGSFDEMIALLPSYGILGATAVIEAPHNQKELDKLISSVVYFDRWSRKEWNSPQKV